MYERNHPSALLGSLSVLLLFACGGEFDEVDISYETSGVFHDLYLAESISLVSDASARQRATTYHPVFDFDTDSCYPATAIDRNGQQNGGLSPTGSITGQCRSSNFLDSSNTYHRWARQSLNGQEYEVHFYELYFEKDQATIFGGGHRHDIELVVIYFHNGHPTHVGTSAHGNITLRSWSQTPKSGNHPKIVYHKDGILTHAFRFAKDDEHHAENSYHQWVFPQGVSWYTMYGNPGFDNYVMTNSLNDFNYGSATFKIKDGRFLNQANQANPSGYPTFATAGNTEPAPVTTPWFSEEQGTGSCPNGKAVNGVNCSGRYCDNLQLTCSNAPGGLQSSSSWTPEFSEEGTNARHCGANSVVTAVSCRGRYCDNLRLRCQPLNRSLGHCFWSNRYSEEQGRFLVGDNYFLKGMQCTGRYCDNKEYYVCRAQ